MKFKSKESKRSKNLSTIIYETYKDFAENTSIHGLKYTVMKEIGSYEKLFWVLVLLSGLAASIYLTLLFWARYSSNPTRTTIQSSYVPTTTIEFPAITICNINRILDSKIDTFLENLEIPESDAQIIKRTLPQVLDIGDATVNLTEIYSFQRVFEGKGIHSMSYLMKSLTQNCSEMVKYCAWNNNQINCTTVFKESLTTEGYCCSFNYGKTDKKYPFTRFNGIGTGLTIILDPMPQTLQYTSYQTSGFKVLIHDPKEYPGPESTVKMITIGSTSYLQMYGKKMACSEDVKKLPFSQRLCYYEDEWDLTTFAKYSYANCLTECEALYYFDKCKCVPYYFEFTGKPQCNVSKLSCVIDIHWDDLETSKVCNCPAQCENDFYDVVAEHSTFDYEESMCMTSFGNTTIKKESMLLNVFFTEQTQLVYLRDTIYSTIYLLASFGGVYSLFMGCSLITAVEIIYYCTFRFLVNCKVLEKVDEEEETSDRVETNNRNKRQFLSIYERNARRGFDTIYLP